MFSSLAYGYPVTVTKTCMGNLPTLALPLLASCGFLSDVIMSHPSMWISPVRFLVGRRCNMEKNSPGWHGVPEIAIMDDIIVLNMALGWTLKTPSFSATCNSDLPFNLCSVNLYSHRISSVTRIQIPGLEGQKPHHHHSRSFLQHPPPSTASSLALITANPLKKRNMPSFKKKNMCCCKGQSSKLQFNRI